MPFLFLFADGFNQEIVGLLFGSISAVSLSDLLTVVVISIVVVLFITLFYKELFILSFDEEYSRVINIPKWIQFLFIVIVAMVISASMRWLAYFSQCINNITHCYSNENN